MLSASSFLKWNKQDVQKIMDKYGMFMTDILTQFQQNSNN